MATVALTIQGSIMTSNMITPTVKINGNWINTQYGLQNIPVPAGRVDVEAYAQWLRTYGQAWLHFTAEPGQVVPVFYAAPMHQFTTGNIGHQKQPRKGMGLFIGMMGFLALVIVCAILVPILSGM